ncbi:ribonuclease H-like domain-containing protein, partial [Tanacetum coccineum]
DINSNDNGNPKTVVGSSSDLKLSFGDLIYLHSNDTNDSNNPGLANQWDMCNSVVVTWILNSLRPELFAGAIYAKTASEIWNYLKETYDKVDGSAVFNLHKNINSLNENAKHFDQHNQLIKLMQFLMGLDQSYLAIRSNLLTREPLPSVKTAFSVISCEESHMNVTFVGITKPATTAFAAKTFDNKKKFNNNYKGFGLNYNSNSNNNNRGPNPNLKCTNCNKTGHTVDRCFESIGYPAVAIMLLLATLLSLSSEQLARLMNLLNENGVSTANANMADVTIENISLGWIVDSRANQHMMVSAIFLSNVVDVSNLGLTVGHSNGTQALITKIGYLKINNEVTLYDVLVVPEYTVSLLSVHKLSRDSKLFFGFDENNCYIQDLKAIKNVGIGKQYNGLYLFDVDNACKIVSNNCIASCSASKTLWHQRLGHPANQVLDVLKSTLNLDSHSIYDHLCDTCNKAKQTREPFPLSNHKKTKIGELVHHDVWGPYKITSRDGFRYFLTIVDDFSRAGELPLYLWTQCILTAVHIINRIPSSVLSGNSRYSYVYGHDPSLSHLRGNDDSGATSMDETNNTHPKGTISDETDFINDFYENSEFNSEIEDLPVHTLRRSSRQTKLPSSLNDFVVEVKVKYGVERVVNYANLNHDNYCFASALNKSVEPTCYKEAILDSNWIDAMNAEIEALNENHTWEITDLPPNRKAIGNKYVIALSVTNNWPLFQLDINNAFLYGDLDEDIYMIIPKEFASKDNKNKENGFVQSNNDHSLLTKSKGNKFIALLVYVDDIVITGNCVDEIDKFKSFLKSKFKIKDLGHLKYFLGIEVIKTVLTKDDPLLDNITGYQKLIGKLIYLTHTKPDIAYSVHCLAQYMHSPLKSHLNSALNVLRHLKGAPGKEAEYISLSSVACEIIWIQKLLLDLNTKVTLPIDLHYDNKSALQLAINPVFHERSKHFEIDVHFIREKIAKGLLNTKKICSSIQIADILTKHLPVYQHKNLCENLEMFDLFSNQIKGKCLKFEGPFLSFLKLLYGFWLKIEDGLELRGPLCNVCIYILRRDGIIILIITNQQTLIFDTLPI